MGGQVAGLHGRGFSSFGNPFGLFAHTVAGQSRDQVHGLAADIVVVLAINQNFLQSSAVCTNVAVQEVGFIAPVICFCLVVRALGIDGFCIQLDFDLVGLAVAVGQGHEEPDLTVYRVQFLAQMVMQGVAELIVACIFGQSLLGAGLPAIVGVGQAVLLVALLCIDAGDSVLGNIFAVFAVLVNGLGSSGIVLNVHVGQNAVVLTKDNIAPVDYLALFLLGAVAGVGFTLLRNIGCIKHVYLLVVLGNGIVIRLQSLVVGLDGGVVILHPLQIGCVGLGAQFVALLRLFVQSCGFGCQLGCICSQLIPIFLGQSFQQHLAFFGFCQLCIQIGIGFGNLFQSAAGIQAQTQILVGFFDGCVVGLHLTVVLHDLVVDFLAVFLLLELLSFLLVSIQILQILFVCCDLSIMLLDQTIHFGLMGFHSFLIVGLGLVVGFQCGLVFFVFLAIDT